MTDQALNLAVITYLDRSERSGKNNVLLTQMAVGFLKSFRIPWKLHSISSQTQLIFLLLYLGLLTPQLLPHLFLFAVCLIALSLFQPFYYVIDLYKSLFLQSNYNSLVYVQEHLTLSRPLDVPVRPRARSRLRTFV